MNYFIVFRIYKICEILKSSKTEFGRKSPYWVRVKSVGHCNLAVTLKQKMEDILSQRDFVSC